MPKQNNLVRIIEVDFFHHLLSPKISPTQIKLTNAQKRLIRF